MRNLILLIITLLTAALALHVGKSRYAAAPGAEERPAATAAPAKTSARASAKAQAQDAVPDKGDIQVLNGCGILGAADQMANFLRGKKFNVTFIGNAPSWNYDSTLVISRTTDMKMAHEVGKHLKTDKVVLMRDDKDLHDVTVIVGPDYQERIK